LPGGRRADTLTRMSSLHTTVHRWTVEEYEELGRKGFIKEDARVELLNGEVVDMSPIGYRHANAVTLFSRLLVASARGQFDVSPQNPFNLDPHSQPLPDLALLDPGCVRLRRLPNPGEIFLVIEDSDSSLHYDRENKGPAYAAQGVREFWLLNLAEDCLEVYRDPRNGAWADRQIIRRDETIAPLAFPDLTLRVGDFLP
jgi:hypothetical protein